eukprot:4946067-Prymnesium_polylepis.2
MHSQARATVAAPLACSATAGGATGGATARAIGGPPPAAARVVRMDRVIRLSRQCGCRRWPCRGVFR